MQPPGRRRQPLRSCRPPAARRGSRHGEARSCGTARTPSGRERVRVALSIKAHLAYAAPEPASGVLRARRQVCGGRGVRHPPYRGAVPGSETVCRLRRPRVPHNHVAACVVRRDHEVLIVAEARLRAVPHVAVPRVVEQRPPRGQVPQHSGAVAPRAQQVLLVLAERDAGDLLQQTSATVRAMRGTSCE